MPKFEIVDDKLLLDGAPLLEGLHAALTADAQQTFEDGLFLRVKFPRPGSRCALALGRPVGWRRFTACHRYEPFWMLPKVGTKAAELPAETQSVLFELDDERIALFVPLVESPFRSALRGYTTLGLDTLVGVESALELSVESGDPQVRGESALCLFIAVGKDPYELIPRAARAVGERLGTGRLRQDKPLPAFCDVFGWCTWDAFYQAVSHDKVLEGLSAFKKGGISPRAIILDDGWQSEHEMPSGEHRLTAFAANAKFPGDLRPTVTMAKEEFGIEHFWVWHAMHGYWSGVDGEKLPGYDVREARRAYAPGILRSVPTFNEEWWGALVGVVPPGAIARFFDDYHRHLAAQGVDGVKVDNQAATEGIAGGLGGRVVLMHAYRKALEASVLRHFHGNLINCMSNSNEMLYAARDSTLVRSSIDFWPTRPETHGVHLYTNAQFGVWFGEFVHPDWDMFHSAHAMGPLHAAGRAVSGSPVYVSDKPGQHDFELLKKLVTSDGRVLRARHVGRPTLDCLFRDPTQEDVLLKVFNFNLDAGLIGVFNARHTPVTPRDISGHVSPSDVHGLAGSEFAVYSHHEQALRRARKDERIPLTLAEGKAEVFTIVALYQGVAAIGLTDKFNSAGAITHKGWKGDSYVVTLCDGGSCLLFSEQRPKSVTVDGKELPFSHDSSRALRVVIAAPGACELRVNYAG
ncbi:MAG TPA: Sip1-related alpha-galactosidase [Polyangiaceae bacterium]|jgi:raffinose synthase